ncbi:MAG: hypothetical protein Kow0029_21660 [Candidatus Rifleibacteriota bacterium]
MATRKQLILESMLELLELPDSAYEKARKRYEDLGEWFGRDDSIVKDNDPHVFPQGSFRLGTAIRPIDNKEEYDLDLVCKLQVGITKESHTQEALKKLVGSEIETYRIARDIKAPLKEKHRCWRLEYQDDLSFHMDIVPCIPADDTRRTLILETMRKAGESELVAGAASQLTVSITDDRHHGYRQICDDWNISNPEGYAKWFEARMNQTQRVILEKAQVDNVPLFKRKTPLQRAIQLLKRHRDQMFKNDTDIKPISIIISTLAARAYQGESDIESALRNILEKMGGLVNTSKPRVPNPVDPAEDFADRWSMPKYQHLNLEKNFWYWLEQAKNDFALLDSTDDVGFIIEQAKQKFSVGLNSSELSQRLGLAVSSISVVTPKSHSISDPAKPWGVD